MASPFLLGSMACQKTKTLPGARTLALDHKTGDAVMNLLATHALSPDRAVVVVTHDTRVLEFANRIAYMDDGRIIRTEEPAVAEVS